MALRSPEPEPVAMTRTGSTDRSTSSSVTVVGRLGGTVVERDLPSGDTVTTFTVVVDRPRTRGSRVTVDAIPCQAFSVRLRTAVGRLEPGTLVEIQGTLRRRFWRSAVGLGSALEVDVVRLSRA